MPHTAFTKCFCLFATLAFLVSSVHAQSDGYFFDDQKSFEKASKRVRTINFESAAPAKGFGKYAPEVGVTVEGIGFRTHGGAKFGAGLIYIPSAQYTALNPGMKMIDGAHMAWGAPNQPGNAHLELTFPPATNAFGVDLWTMQPITSPIEIVITTRDGKTYSRIFSTRRRPDSSFAGFVSESPISTVRFTPAKGQSTLLLDNLAFGARADGIDIAALAAASSATASIPFRDRERPITTAKRSDESMTSASETPASPTLQPVAATTIGPGKALNVVAPRGKSSPSSASGVITYVRQGKEIRSIAPDGSNDRRFWSDANAHEGLGINELAWSPDYSELAFSSGHDAVASFYHADIYSIKPDGSGLRKITNGPDRSEYSKFPKGTVTVTIRNDQPIYQTTKASTGVFFIYVVGADVPQPLTLPPGSSRTLTFKNVADFGDHAQAVVAVYGGTRWFIPGTDVKAGKVVKAPDFGISGNGMELFGAFRPVWKHDGSTISYRSGLCIVSKRSARPSVGHVFDPVFKGENPPAPCAWDFGRTAETADHVLYSVMDDEEITIYRLKGTGQHPGEKLLSISKEKFQFINDLRWLPDGSGFLYTGSDLGYSFANIMRYDLATRQTTQVTNLEESFAKGFSISPDGKWVVFERTKGFVDDDADLWIVGMDGKDLRLLAKDANNPAWGK